MPYRDWAKIVTHLFKCNFTKIPPPNSINNSMDIEICEKRTKFYNRCRKLTKCMNLLLSRPTKSQNHHHPKACMDIDDVQILTQVYKKLIVQGQRKNAINCKLVMRMCLRLVAIIAIGMVWKIWLINCIFITPNLTAV